MTPSMSFLLAFGILGVLSGVNFAVPLPAGEVDQQAPAIPAKLPFSLELEPPLPDSTSGAAKAAVLPLRDSYGNPIPPSVLGVDPDYGLETPKITVNKTITNQGINFPIPSYASGITEIHRPSDGLLPPFKPTAGDTVLPPLPTTSSVPLPVTDLIPPLPKSPIKDDTINEISGKALQERFGTSFTSQALPSVINDLQPATPSSKPSVIGSVSGLSTANTPPPLPVISSSSPAKPAVVPLAVVPSVPVTAEPGKYTGGFGGAPGVLGEQKQPGFLIKPEAGAAAVAPVIPPTTSTTTTTAAPIPSFIAAVAGGSSSGSKYTGGFGGPPGILVPFDNVKKDS